MTSTNSPNPDISNTELEQWIRRCKRLESENGEQKRKLTVYQENIKTLSRLLSVGSVGKTYKQIRTNATSDVQAVLSIIACYINSSVLNRVKLLPSDWVKWNEAPRSVCQRFLGRARANIPAMWLEEVFWHVYLVPATREIFINQRTNTTATLKVVFECKTSVR